MIPNSALQAPDFSVTLSLVPQDAGYETFLHRTEQGEMIALIYNYYPDEAVNVASLGQAKIKMNFRTFSGNSYSDSYADLKKFVTDGELQLIDFLGIYEDTFVLAYTDESPSSGYVTSTKLQYGYMNDTTANTNFLALIPESYNTDLFETVTLQNFSKETVRNFLK